MGLQGPLSNAGPIKARLQGCPVGREISTLMKDLAHPSFEGLDLLLLWHLYIEAQWVVAWLQNAWSFLGAASTLVHCKIPSPQS